MYINGTFDDAQRARANNGKLNLQLGINITDHLFERACRGAYEWGGSDEIVNHISRNVDKATRLATLRSLLAEVATSMEQAEIQGRIDAWEA